VSISGSQPVNGIAIRYRRLSARHYLGRCSRKWREHPRGSFLTYRPRKWPTHPPYGEKLVPPSLEAPCFPSTPAILRRSFRLSCLARSKRLRSRGSSGIVFLRDGSNLAGGKDIVFSCLGENSGSALEIGGFTWRSAPCQVDVYPSKIRRAAFLRITDGIANHGRVIR